MKILSVITSVVFSSYLLLTSGCSDSTVSSPALSGKVSAFNIYPVPGLKVSIGDQSTTTGSDGSFSFQNASMPYDLILTDTVDIKSISIYKNLTTSVLNLNIETDIIVGLSTFLRVYLPPSINLKKLQGEAIFTDGNYISRYANLDTGATFLEVQIPDNSPVIGRIIILTYIKDAAGDIISYENYGESQLITLYPLQLRDYTFDSASVALNPGEQTVNATIQSGGPQKYYSEFNICFGNYTPYYPGSLFEFRDKEISFIIPSGIPLPFRSILNVRTYEIENLTGEVFELNPFDANILSIKDPGELINPPDHTKNVTNETVFTFENGGGEGVNAIDIIDKTGGFRFTIYTTDNSFTLEGLSELGFGSISNHDFAWGVWRKGIASSTNEFVTDYKNTQGSFYSISGIRYFSTAP